jgi:peroxiredoxin
VKSRVYLFLPVIIFLLAGLALAMGENPNMGGGPEIGKIAADFTLDDLSGKEIQLSDYRGKTIFLNFWASWCPPCREEMPSIQKLHERLDGKDFMILAVALDKGDVKPFVQQGNYSFTVLVDPRGMVAEKYQIVGIPTTFIIDEKGMIKQRFVGSRDWSGFNP